MNRREQREARREARELYMGLLSEGHTPKQAKVELDKWGKKKYGALPWASIIAFLMPLIQEIIKKWLKT